MSNSGYVHWKVVKWLLRYIKGSTGIRLMFTKSGNMKVQGYCDSDFAADLDRRRSISVYILWLEEMLLAGSQDYNKLWLYQLQRLSIFLSQKQ